MARVGADNVHFCRIPRVEPPHLADLPERVAAFHTGANAVGGHLERHVDAHIAFVEHVLLVPVQLFREVIRDTDFPEVIGPTFPRRRIVFGRQNDLAAMLNMVC